MLSIEDKFKKMLEEKVEHIPLCDNITQEILKDLVSYDKNTGIFIKLKKTHSRDNKPKVGEVLGYLDGRGYFHFSVLGKKYKAHRLAWLYEYGYMPEMIDHIDGNPRNNAISNLRPCTSQQNRINKNVISSLSGYKGVYPKRNSKGDIISWYAQYDKTWLGGFKNKEDAAKAYDSYVTKEFGEFAKTNKEILSNV